MKFYILGPTFSSSWVNGHAKVGRGSCRFLHNADHASFFLSAVCPSTRPIPISAFERQREALQEFDVTLTFCFTPKYRGIQPTGRLVQPPRFRRKPI